VATPIQRPCTSANCLSKKDRSFTRRDLGLILQHNLSEPANFLTFQANKRYSDLSLARGPAKGRAWAPAATTEEVISTGHLARFASAILTDKALLDDFAHSADPVRGRSRWAPLLVIQLRSLHVLVNLVGALFGWPIT
jgi:hypothetical protein